MTNSADHESLDHALLIEGSFLFERDWYLVTYPDVAESRGDPLEHYLLHGITEGRNPNRLFDTRWYMSAYLEHGAGQTNPLVHYILRGAKMGCDPHPFFSTAAYLEKYPEATDQELTPLADYLTRTILLDPDSFPSFSRYDVMRLTQANYLRLEAEELARHLETMLIEPIFVIIIDGDEREARARTNESVLNQVYKRYLVATSPAEAARLARDESAEPRYIVWLDAGDTLNSDALYRYASAINIDPDVDMIYSDYEYSLESTSWTPVYKPGWSPDYLESYDYIGSGLCARFSKASDALEHARSRYDFILRFSEQPINVAHLDQILLQAAVPGWKLRAATQLESDIEALSGRLARTGRQGVVTANIPDQRSYTIEIKLGHHPLVSIVIPTAARIIEYEGETIDLITQCIDSIFSISSYPNFEIIIIDNGDFDRDRLSPENRKRIKFITYAISEVSIAKKINLGAAYAAGDIILILNDDIKPLTKDWIERMVAHFEKPHVGLVGAKLLYPNGKIQHVGVAVCNGKPEHVSRGKSQDDVGYCFSTIGVRNYLAVTGAVTMTTAAYFRKVGGYSEDFPIDFNDIDFSYKYISYDLSVVYEPKAVLTHYESVSFVKPPRPGDEIHFYSKWGRMANDPYYNEYRLAKHPPTFDIAFTERRH